MTGDMPPICSQTYFHVQPFSRLMSRSFSVRSARFMIFPPYKGLARGRVITWPSCCFLRSSNTRLGKPPPHYRHMARIVIVAYVLDEGPASTHQEIDDVITRGVVERMFVKIISRALARKGILHDLCQYRPGTV